MAEWIMKQEPTTFCLQSSHFSFKETHRLKVKGWKKIFHKTKQRSYLDKIDFKSKNCNKMQGKSLNIDRVNLSKGYKNYKHTCTKHQNTNNYTAMLTELEGEIDSNTMMLPTQIDVSYKQKLQ
jgi:hypothetical protein